MPRKTDKRARLIDAAMKLINQQSFNFTTLADIAHKADVPLGNVYYYFKKKEDIGEAVIEKLAIIYSELLKVLNDIPNPINRLKSFIKSTIASDNLEQIARYGCPVGGLCQELSKQGGPLADRAAKLLHDLISWSESQFDALGCGAEAADLAQTLIAGIQGSYLLTHTFKDPQFAIRQSEILLNWVDQISGKTKIAKTADEEAFA